MQRIKRQDSEYLLIENSGHEEGKGSLMLLYRGYRIADGIDGDLCCGSADLTEDSKWEIMIAAPLRLDDHSIRQIGIVDTQTEALKILWEQRLWMNWSYFQ